MNDEKTRPDNMVDKSRKIKNYTPMIYEDDLYEGDPETWSRPLWKTEILIGAGLPGAAAQDLADALEDHAVSIFLHNREATDGDCWTVHLSTLGPPDEAALRAGIISRGFPPASISLTVAPVEQKDWLRHVHENFPPVTAGRFFIYGSHYEGENQEGLIPLKIDAATAFGSGEHETTKGCLLALAGLAQAHDFKSGLDMGCGSGILAIAMTKLWPAMRVLAVDIDPESITVTRRHAAMNGADIATEAGDGYRAPLVPRNGPYDVVVANILAGPLVAMAAELAGCLKPGGFAVLSGLLSRQMAEVLEAHTALGFTPAGGQRLGDWETLVLRKT